ncbi:hypothetical protein [Konateibacter massiliensis]|uniref:hypothetical protein n=1 Tax=Konateibacter massiliensis TaxID=2002841 RepID=UPI000C151C5D|nr:hypothetical protein [Konateibacter massiliensis]
MQEFISNVQTLLEVYRGIGKITLLLTAIFGMMLVKSNQRRRVILLYAIIGSMILLNPFLLKQESVILGDNHIYRLGMVLLIPILSSYALTVVYKGLTDKKEKLIVMAGIICLVAFSGKFVYTSEYFHKSANEGKVYDLAVDLADCVTAVRENPTVAVSEVQGVFIRQHNASIRLVCAPEQTENWAEKEDENIWDMRAMLADPAPDMAELTELAKVLGCDYLILLDDQLKADSPENYGFIYVNTFEAFQVFENPEGGEG